MTKPKPPQSPEASNLVHQVLADHARLSNENRRLREVLEELSEYSPDCDHDVIAQRALYPAEPVKRDHRICPPGECLYP